MIWHMIWFLLIGIVACSGGKTVIRSEPPTAFVTINDIPKGVTPLEVKLDCDKTKEYKIKISYPGYQTKTKNIECGYIRGAKKQIFFELEPGEDTAGGETPSIPQTLGDFATIKIKSMPSEAEVYLNNELIGTSPLVKKK
ncbi:MAG TPA: PEGA domain-containing protein, partial [Thermodesulfobacteriota bacterium]|nr:PEGA domain-containing protein [Thermodesulfobacteriota bacterium]